MKDLVILKRLAKNLRGHRARCGLSQEELGNLAGLHRTYVGAVERGERNISLGSLERLARALGVPPAILISDSEDEG